MPDGPAAPPLTKLLREGWGLPHESDRQVELQARHLDLASNGASVRRIIAVLGEVLG